MASQPLDFDPRPYLNKLSWREREIIKLRYGLGKDGCWYTLEEIGHIFKVTRERVRCVLNKGIAKMISLHASSAGPR